ncbi:penicillin binding protein 2 [Legionella geestiana]|uniref:Peptidoglycan D,D-transpeptidase MrdA n=1 Tax=Legionella geestiana TaxID=45065 RepID=A0A0W0TZ61_9GAMM|nr:penicillin-binding protein 2 [Legionella geestiana]KTD00710.1 penicillin binding protein 2 [Legionella geestiana]QBS11571.1 penicillin-binding protein 2 [Legionella geestiana]QDQ40821.1 penicillin-binding protein 2 [Legionella geestiana]STX53755.1 penicillin binding protein 2 [Legionella geestiana]
MRSSLYQKPVRTESETHKIRLTVLIVLVFLLTLVLIGRMFWLQIADYRRYETLSRKNQISVIPIAPPRGLIFDRNGVVLAENVPVYVLEIIPERVKNLQDTLERLKALLPSVTDEDIATFNRLRRQNRAFMSIPFKLKLTQEEVATFAISQYRFPGVSIKARLMRYYPLKNVTAHLLGYVARINAAELRTVDSKNYQATNFIGKSGVEKYYEDLLHGQVGYQQVETDVSGRTVRVLERQSPLSGEKLYLTIDARLQQAAFDAMGESRGAVVVINPNNGEVLAMVSTPSFDPNLFVNGITHADYQQLTNERERPLYNRAVRGLYPPASTIKPYVALAGLDRGFVTTNTTIYDPGWFRLPNVSHQYRDWKRGGHGMIHLKRAIAVSCDTYFYHLGNRMGINAIEEMLTRFGFGQLTHIDLNEEAPGIVPNTFWKRQTRGLPWYPGDTLISAIGQGFMLASPLQIANAVATMSQKGHRYRPHLLAHSVQSDTGAVHHTKILEEYPVRLRNDANWDIVHEGMQSVLTSNEGTGYRFGRNPPFSMAGKTGTAQVFGGKQYEKRRNQVIPEYLRDHSLFIGFSPVENPQVAIAVMVENDTLASQVARKIMDTWYTLHPDGAAS